MKEVGQDVARFPGRALMNALQVGEQLAVRELMREGVGGVQRQSGLADTAHTVDGGDHHSARRTVRFRGFRQVQQLRELVLASRERPGVQRKLLEP
ncbi:hypothetical protein ACFQ9X_08860 [Catenulispora yoronensis]